MRYLIYNRTRRLQTAPGGIDTLPHTSEAPLSLSAKFVLVNAHLANDKAVLGGAWSSQRQRYSHS